MKTLVIALLLVLVPVGVYLAPAMIVPTTRRRALLRCVLPVLVLGIAAVSVYGVVRWCQQRGCVWEQHVVGEYRFKFTSDRDPDWERYDGYVRDDVFVSVYREGRLVVGSIYIGFVADPVDPLTFTVRRVPNESLIIVTPTARENDVVFVYDTATGESCPSAVAYKAETDEMRKQRRERLGTRIRACPGCEQCRLGALWPPLTITY
jgi:hypothetical protein